MLQVTGIEKSYGDRLLFKDMSFSLTPGERLALVGRNGTGKSTLFRMILGEEHPDAGHIVVPKGYTVGHLSQHLHFTAPSILAEACRGLPPGAEDEEYKAHIILDGLGFSYADFERPASDFSGGFQIRVELARVLLSQPNLLLLDEPTNYLDIVSARWLEHFLTDWQNELIIISHDRTFLDAVSTHTMIIHRGTARKVKGGTDKLYSIISQDEEIYEQTRINQEKKRREVEQFIAKFKAKAGTASLAQSRQKMLDKMEIGEALQEIPELDFRFNGADFYGKTVLEAREISFRYPPSSREPDPPYLIKDFSLTITPGDRIGVIGKNGRGKSTLLKLMAGELAPEAGGMTTSPHLRLGYFGQTNIQRLSNSLTVEQEIGGANNSLHRTAVRAICGTMMFPGDDALKPIKILSGGERSRVLLGKILAQPTNLLLLDEPTNHLDIESVMAMVDSLAEYSGAVVIVTHDEFMLRKLAKRLVVFDDSGVNVVEGDYDYFLETRGWGDDTAQVSRRGSSSKAAGAKDRDRENDRKARAKSREARIQKLKPIENEVKRIESEIIDYESRLKKTESELIDASVAQNSGRLAELARTRGELETKIEALFSDLERLEAERKLAEGDLE